MPRSKSPKPPSPVMGVMLAEVDESVLERNLIACNLKTDGPLGERVKRMVRWFRQNTPKAELADCDTCGGDSDVRLEACPYCGDGEVVGEEPTVAAVSTLTAEKAAASSAYGKPTVLAESDLDKSVREIIILKQRAAGSIWELGQAIRRNYTDELWKQRRVKGGDARAYRNWKQFCAAELGMSHTHAYKLMDVAAAFTQKDIDKIGSSKLGLVLQVPEQFRKQLLDAARGGASKGKMAEQVKRLREKDEGPQKPPKAKQKQQPPRITMALGDMRVDLAMYKVGTDDKPAKRLADKPWAEEMLTNDVTVRYVLTVNESGELVLVVERHRTAFDQRTNPEALDLSE